MARRDDREQIEDLLAGVPFFAELSRGSLRNLAKLCVRRKFLPGKKVLVEGSVGLGMFVIVSGRVEVYKGEGEERVDLGVLERGDILGEMALIDDKPRSATAKSVEAVECLLISRNSFHTLVRRDPEIAWCIVPSLAERVRDLQQRLVEEEEEDRRTAALAMGEAARSVPSRVESSASTHPGSGRDEEEEEGEETDGRRVSPGVTLLRTQHAALLAAFSGLSGTVEVGGTFFRSLARESGLTESGRLREVLRRLPSGTLTAFGDAMEAGERLPERMVRTFRRQLKRR